MKARLARAVARVSGTRFMSRSVICHGCGQRLEVDDAYTRNKVQCGCGVFCELPPPARREDEAFPAAPRRDPPPAPAAPEPPARPRRPVTPSPPTTRREDQGLVTCPNCGELVRPLQVRRGRARQCPSCGASLAAPDAKTVRLPPAPPPPAVPAPQPLGDRVPLSDDEDLLVRLSNPPPKPVLPPPAPDDEDDGRPYVFVETGERNCPGCGKLLAPGVTECPGCEFDLEAGRKLDKVYAPVSFTWHAGMSPAKRWTLFLLAESIMVVPCVIVAIAHVSLLYVLGPLSFYTLLVSFLLGTWDRLDLTRDRKGKVQLTQTWYICFIPRAPDHIKIYSYEGISTGTDWEAGCWEWFVFWNLFFSGVVPGLLWWYFVIHQDVFFVALTKDHGFPDRKIYRGRDDDRMREIAGTIRDVADMRWEQGTNL
jgi:Double zinc ribbon